MEKLVKFASLPGFLSLHPAAIILVFILLSRSLYIAVDFHAGSISSQTGCSSWKYREHWELHSTLTAMRSASLPIALLVSMTMAQQCYFPDGSPSKDVPCNGSATHSACCTSTAYCLSNGLCLNDVIPSRGSCTDKTWASGSCAQYCQKSNLSGGYALMSCSSTTFTCGFYPDNCGTSSSTFTIENAGGIILRDYQLANAMQAADVSNGPVASAIASSTSVPSSDDESHNKKYSTTSMVILGVVIAVVLLLVHRRITLPPA